ncbi:MULTISPECIES: UPF0182 family protein [Kocuria]|uniref:UPF0182 protein KRH_08700 n=1 Tax=Kocuria rhizophila (strain ATCC 9341 / DSM 348 / NBRC 103217 / DC2201) TaxID=378753 RepID=Y870_KOCRD|nr:MULTISPECIES: UPF0182 family protein [Kocuria]B2GL41.1 RecName: Full=UPF0182 protein KRH_08700 [Kocuria rhizophila DC2201]ASE10844.1 UPF0182 family protein [Kocuria rhizophila]BAG29217.1 hypothetical membrane protein [Kocuria rhizophila DC2201]VEH75502.1 Uncharacterised protein family (UPF0182) [Kocuria rhizophila]
MTAGSTSPRPSARSASGRPKRGALLPTVIAVVVLIALFVGFTQVYTNILWFEQLGYLRVFITRNLAVIGLFVAAALIVAALMFLSLWLAHRHRPRGGEVTDTMRKYQQALDPVRKVVMVAVPLIFGLFAASTVATQWQTVMLFFNQEPFGQTDPQFSMDLGFYVFTLPFLRLLIGFLVTALLLAGVAGLLMHYVYGGIRIHERGITTTRAARVHLGSIVAAFLALQAVNFWLDRYSTLISSSGKWTGAMYTDVNAVIPTKGILAVAALLVAVLFVVAGFIGRWKLPLIGAAMLVVVAVVAGGLYPWAIQRFQVTPTEQALEKEFIQRNITMTRQAYGLDDTQVTPYDATTETEKGALRQDTETTSNIRLLDPNVVSSAFAQLQQFRPYYQFPEMLNVDRYDIDGQSQDTVIATRELNPDQIQGWYNQSVVYTHGYGVVAAYGSRVQSDGKPQFMQAGIPSKGEISDDYEPRIYFGEKSPNYSIVGGAAEDAPLELDRPQTNEGDAEDAKTTFTGNGGPNVGNWFNKLAYSIKFQSTDMLLSDAVRPESQILYDRNPRERVEKVAPYLTVDGKPYPAIVDNKVVWIVDAYTTAASYPYSSPSVLQDATKDTQTAQGTTAALPNERVNYIRNSVKATVNAYDGSVELYAWDDQDPVLKSWQNVFPSTVKPYSEMSADLMAHVRYPEDMFKVQRELLNRYHVTDANSFYANDDVWSVPNDPTQQNRNVSQPPYYLSMRMPGEKEANFSLTSSFIPQQNESGNTRNVMYGYLSANADAGTGKDGVKSENYGKLRLLELPRSSVVPGPGQAQNLFNSDTDVSQELNLLRQGASEVINGNLLTLPAGGGMLYVQPVYVQSSGDAAYPTLRRVLVGFGEKVGFAPTLDGALDEVFGGNSGAKTDTGAGVSEKAAEAAQGGKGKDSTPSPSPSGTPVPRSSSLQEALDTANKAMQDSDKAMKDGDWTKYGEAQDRLKRAIDDAMAQDGATK